MRHKTRRGKRLAALLAVITLLAAGCDTGRIKLDANNPVTVTVWHYYNGAILNAFDDMVSEFNETLGHERGIIVEHVSHGDVTLLEAAVRASANREIGSDTMPNIFAAYGDHAYALEGMDMLADLDVYLTEEELAGYYGAFLEEGRIGNDGELRILPVAKSTEALMINETDWLPFAEARALSYDDLNTMEGVARVSEMYYNWTDGQTPDVPNDGKAFFGRDVMANLFVVASREFGVELFASENGVPKITADPLVMRKIWDCYYVPYISGYYASYGRFRSDDAKVGDILAYVGSTASASYFPSEVNVGGKVHSVAAKILPAPNFEGGGRITVQQGAGMAVSKSEPKLEYASVEFLKWFTETENNIRFSSLSSYMPVTNDAIDYDLIKSQMAEAGTELDEKTDETLRVSIEGAKTGEMYTYKAFTGGAAARAILERHLSDRALADREAVVRQLGEGTALEQAVAQFDTDASFEAWLDDLVLQLNEAAK